MKSLIVYESLWGNTAEVAHAIGGALGADASVDVVDVSDAPCVPASDVDLLVVGGPTHTFSMSRPDTRKEAVTRGASSGPPGIGIREWISDLPDVRDGRLIALFDTRVEKVRRLPGSAARKAARRMRRLGYALVVDAESFYVCDVEGPLVAGELDRAGEWGRRLGSLAQARYQARSHGLEPGGPSVDLY